MRVRERWDSLNVVAPRLLLSGAAAIAGIGMSAGVIAKLNRRDLTRVPAFHRVGQLSDHWSQSLEQEHRRSAVEPARRPTYNGVLLGRQLTCQKSAVSGHSDQSQAREAMRLAER